ncbi:hypothetical protein CAEBREN_22143 [Caenorhabditis brenneri]|uniref:Uncharacterized protein n=1 Tax=Caenorhabditis brenneri TaxID=135651 RepID=G0PFA3_CAEBE|nr:hypothetical protein CAEBREN_22143 [Caenorhabditis brenneri]
MIAEVLIGSSSSYREMPSSMERLCDSLRRLLERIRGAGRNDDEDEEGDGIPDYPYPIQRVRRLYSKFARNEIWEVVDRGIELHEVLGIISLPHFARVSCLQYILFPFDTLKVTIGFRKVNIRIRNSQTNEESYAQYEWKRDGCIVR